MKCFQPWSRWFKGVFAFALSLGAALPVMAQNSASVVMYHRFGEKDFPSTNITLEQFDDHINEIKTGGYNVLPLSKLVDLLQAGKPLPDKALSITIDDGYASIYKEAYPRFKKAGIPFTIFISTDPIDRGYAGMLNWDQLKKMADDPLVEIGAHTASHLHMAAASQARIGDEMIRSLTRIEEKLGLRPNIFAFPYGEASESAISVVRGFGIRAAFGQHSGAIGPDDDMFYLARFALNETYGDLKRFQMVAQSKSLHVKDLGPTDMMVGKRNPPNLGFTVSEEVGDLDALACFASHEGKVQVERLWERRVEVRMKKQMPVGRTRLNCTLPAQDGRWRWFGRQFYVEP